MASASLSSQSLTRHAKIFTSIVTVDELKEKVFKPHPNVYYHLADKVGKRDKLADVWVITANPFDVVGARSVGMQAAWVDREGRGWEDQCIEGKEGQPTIIGKDLREVVEKLLNI